MFEGSPDMNSHKVVIIQEVHPVNPDLSLHGPDDAPGGVHDLLRELEVVPNHVTEHGAHKPEVWVVCPRGHRHPEVRALALPALLAAPALAPLIPDQRRG